MGFDEEYQSFLDGHLQVRSGERLRRLKEGHGKAEMLFLQKVWWPQFQDFQYLHPEYEVNDYKDGKRFLDFAYIRQSIRICFEIDGFGPHLKDVSRWQFADQLARQNQLVIDGWSVIRFSYDHVVEKPRWCQQVTQLIVGKMVGEEWKQVPLTCLEKESIRLALRKGVAITPGEAESLLHLSDKPVRRILAELVRKGILLPASGKIRITSYRLSDKVKSPFQ